MDKELVSVIVPIYQVKAYVRKCIESIMVQEYENIEILLVDDGSTDGSAEICDEYAKLDSRIHVIHKENAGLSAARNTGIKYANGKYIAFVDSDDWIDRRYIDAMYNIIDKNNCEIVQCGYLDVIDETIDFYDRISTPIFMSGIEMSYATYTLLSWKCNLTWNKLYKREVFEGIWFPEGKIHEDEFTTYKLLLKSGKVAVLPSKLYFYRHRKESIMNQKYSLKRLHAGEAYDERMQVYKEAELTDLANLTEEVYMSWIDLQIPHLKKLNTEEAIAKIEAFYLLKQQYEAKKISPKKYTNHGFLFPYHLIERNSDIIIYGAGNVGTQFFRQIIEINYCNVIGWIDKNYTECRKVGVPAQSVNILASKSMKYDCIVVAIEKESVVRNIIDELVTLYGVPRDKIIYQICKV